MLTVCVCVCVCVGGGGGGGMSVASFPGSPLAPMKNKNRGRAWYRFTRDITAKRCHSNNCKSRDAINT